MHDRPVIPNYNYIFTDLKLKIWKPLNNNNRYKNYK